MPQNDELVHAAHSGDLNQVKKLIEAGANPNSVDANGMGTLLNFHPHVTKYLLEQGANPDLQRNENISPVLAGVSGFNTECVKLMLDAGANPNQASHHNGETALHHAASGSDTQLVQALLTAGANPNHRTTPGMTTYALWRDARVRGETPLHRAAAFGSPEVIQLLLDAGGDPSLRDAHHDTPLSWASWHQREKSIIDQLYYDGSGVGPDIPVTKPKDACLLQKFWQAVTAGNVAKTTALLAQDTSLAGTDCRPAEQRNQHTNGFPLVQAAKDGNIEIAEVLLQRGADPNARSPAEDQREFGMPLIFAFDNRNYDLVCLLLDSGASVHAYPYCDICLVDRVFIAASEQPEFVETVSSMVRHSYENYLLSSQSGRVGIGNWELSWQEATENVRLLARVLMQGGRPSLAQVVRQNQIQLLKDLLDTCPESRGTQFDYPNATVFENIWHAASWYGYPEVIEFCRQACPQMHDYEAAKGSLFSATKSHNRDGSYADYRRIILLQLEYLKNSGQLDKLKNDQPPFKAHQLLAANYCWHNNYGYRAGISRPEDLLDLAELFIEYGFEDFDYRDPKTGRSPLATAVARGTHPGMLEYVEFLIARGANLCSDDPADTNPLELAKQIDASEHSQRRDAFIKLLSNT